MPCIIEADVLPSSRAWPGLSGALFDDVQDILSLHRVLVTNEFREDSVDPFLTIRKCSPRPFSQACFQYGAVSVNSSEPLTRSCVSFIGLFLRDSFSATHISIFRVAPGTEDAPVVVGVIVLGIWCLDASPFLRLRLLRNLSHGY